MDVPELLEQAWSRNLNEALEQRGWSAIRLEDAAVYEKPVGESHWRFAADVLRQSKRLIVMPKVGVRFPVISESVGRLMGQDRAGTATVGIDLVHLVRRAESRAGASRWVVSGVDRINPVIELLLDDLGHAGELFYKEFLSIEMLLEKYRNYSLTPPQLLDVAVAFMMCGRSNEATEILKLIKSDDSVADVRMLLAIEELELRVSFEGG